jgi:uncharacterized membrane protein YphA (DoxX/SURF4 family)
MKKPTKAQQTKTAKRVLFLVLLFYVLYVAVKPIADLLFRGINAVRSWLNFAPIPQAKIDAAVLMVVTVVVTVALAIMFSPVVALVASVAFVFGASYFVKSRQKTLEDQEGEPFNENL